MQQQGKLLCFFGTPCQVAALKAFLYLGNVDLKNLICVDLICHGAPNQQVFDEYLKELELIERDKVKTFYFRNKEEQNGLINSRSAFVEFSSGNIKILNSKNDPFLRAYYERLFYRPACGSCIFARPERISDITIGDAWHIEELYPEWDSLKGVSLILGNTPKGWGVCEKLSSKMFLREISLNWAIEHNQQLMKPTKMSSRRKRFFYFRRTKSFYRSVNLAMKNSILHKIINKINSIRK